MTLYGFLLDRIAEDETRARESKEYDDKHQPVNDVMDLDGWYDPERVLAECEAKRQIVELANYWLEPVDPGIAGSDLLHLLALPYADHPDYQQEWGQ
jgi:hypothetical protein